MAPLAGAEYWARWELINMSAVSKLIRVCMLVCMCCVILRARCLVPRRLRRPPRRPPRRPLLPASSLFAPLPPSPSPACTPRPAPNTVQLISNIGLFASTSRATAQTTLRAHPFPPTLPGNPVANWACTRISLRVSLVQLPHAPQRLQSRLRPRPAALACDPCAARRSSQRHSRRCTIPSLWWP